MSSRKFAVERKGKSNFQGKKLLKNSSSGKQSSLAGDSFFMKPNRSKKNHALDIAVSQKSKPATSQQEFPKKKGKQSQPSESTQDKHDDSKKVSKPFDKKAWRFKRYSKKYKLDQWKDERKSRILRGFDKTLSPNTTKFNFEEKYMDHTESTSEEETKTDGEPSFLNNDSISSTDNRGAKSTSIKRNKMNQDEEINNKKAEYLKRKAEKEAAIKEYKRKKIEKFKKLNRKTKKGQPVMKGRIEVLLEEIQESLGR